MVIDLARSDHRDRVDRALRALSDPTRRDIVRRAARGEHSVSELARAYPISFAAVHKHLAVLEGADLIVSTRRGRERLVRARVDGLRVARAALEGLEALWRDRVERMDEIVADERK